MSIDESKKVFDELHQQWVAIKDSIETEQDTRLQIIDRMLIEVLGWHRIDIRTEPSVDSGYVDYLLQSDHRNRFVVEAKKADRLLVDTRNPRCNSYKSNGPALESARQGLNQARRYCSDTGVIFSALTSGFEWIAYWAVRTDGVPPGDGKAIVFPNLDSINDNFALFYDLFSKNGVLNNLFQIRIHEAEGLKVRHAEALESVFGENDIRLLHRSDLASDLEIIFRQFFSTMSGEDDPEMLAKCFVESKESREADISLEKITRHLLSQVSVVETNEGSELESHIRAAVESERGEFVLIIGNKGAGKSTFIDRFFRLVLERALREHCLVVRIDLADSGGDISKITSWLTERAKREIEINLFQKGNPTYEELQGIFHSEYERWRHGEHKFLYERSKSEFKERFGQYIDDMVNRQPEKYVERLLQHAVLSRKLMPCIVLDNTDHHSQIFQEHVFQYAQALHRAVFSFVICPITDRTIWQLSKYGPLQSYDTQAFYLPVPSTKDVLQKRISYLTEKIESESKKSKGDYVLTKGMRLSIQDIGAFAATIDDMFVKTDYVSRMVGWLSNHDIRRSLKISQRIITSPIISMEDLIRTYVAGSRLSIPRMKIIQALLFGNYSQFNQGANEYVLNVFSVDPENVGSPLLVLSILRLMMDREFQAKDAESAYISINDIQNYLEPCGFDRGIVKANLKTLLTWRLVEPYDPTDQDVYEDQRVRVTHSGQIHFEFTQRDLVYVQSMALTTPMRDHMLVEHMKDKLRAGKKMMRDDWSALRKEFMEYVLNEDNLFVTIPNIDMYSGQRFLRQELSKMWVSQASSFVSSESDN